MAVIKPFAALRPKPALAGRICELPYDVMSSDEARQIAAGNPLSFLHVSKPEIDLPAGTDLYSDEVYAKGAENFARLIGAGDLVRDAQPCFYLYRQVMGSHTQTGLVAAASCDDYLEGVIKKHELTRVDKEDDRMRHITSLNAQTGPAFLVYRAVPALDEFVSARTAEAPQIDFVAADGVRHMSWRVADAAGIAFVEAEFKRLPCLYIADGHHRTAAAGRIARERGGAGGSGAFLAVIFPHNQTRILPYHRVLKDLDGLDPRELLSRLETVFTLQAGGAGQPGHKHELGLFLAGQWRRLVFRPEFTSAPDPLEQLDVALLQKHVLAPLFGIADPRTSQRIHFVGGIRGSGELERLVGAGEYSCAFALFPTSIQDLMAIADAGGIMPPKSTWFEPKLRDGMFCHMI